MSRAVYIYNDEGTAPESVSGWVSVLKWTLRYPQSLIHTVKAVNIVQALHAQEPKKTLLIVPGGADLPYLHSLDDTCISAIRTVVAAGGSYLGVCAGAYFASSKCIFEKEDQRLRVVGQRPLALFPYPAVGAVRENFAYNSEAGATLERLHCQWRGRSFLPQIYCNGGPAWDCEASEKTVIIARYEDPVLKRHGIGNDSPIAALKHAYGNDGTVVLCGVHPELPFHTDRRKWDSETMDQGRVLFLRSLAEAACLTRTGTSGK